MIDFLKAEAVEPEFVELVENALTVELLNADKLSEEDRKLFPTGEDGVAQGCPLSALAGNIVLEDFDRQMNDRAITCVRYIDDFIVIGKTLTAVQKAMAAAKAILAGLRMDIYDPIKSPSKAFIGTIGDPHVFLGYKLLPAAYPPADAACDKLMAQVRELISKGQLSISKAVTHRTLTNQDRCYAQTLVAIDHTVRGWRASLRASDCPEVFEALDKEIDRRLSDFRSFFLEKMVKRTATQQRCALRVRLLAEAPEPAGSKS